MIAVLPSHIAGETYESLLGRLGRRAFAGGVRALRCDNAHRRCTLIPPQEFIASLANPAWMTLRELLDEHTLLPIIRPFLDADEADSLSARLAQGAADSRVSSFLSEHERHCPDCRKVEFDSFAESGVQALHQLRWLTKCHVHHCMLSDGRDLSPTVFPNELLACAPTLSRPDLTLLNGIQKSTVWLAKANLPPLGRQSWRSFHRASLTRRFGISSPFFCSDLYKVARLVSKRLTKLLWLPMLSSQSNWVQAAVRFPRGTTHPLHHIVLLRLCGETTATAVEKIRARKASPGGGGVSVRQLEFHFK
jgi:hypothetical protein